MTPAEATAVIEKARREPQDRRRVYPAGEGFLVLIGFCPWFTIPEWKAMHPRHRWAWLAYLTAPTVTLEQAEAIVDDAAAMITDENWATVQRNLALVEGVIAKAAQRARDARFAEQVIERREIMRKVDEALGPFRPHPRPRRRNGTRRA